MVPRMIPFASCRLTFTPATETTPVKSFVVEFNVTSNPVAVTLVVPSMSSVPLLVTVPAAVNVKLPVAVMLPRLIPSASLMNWWPPPVVEVFRLAALMSSTFPLAPMPPDPAFSVNAPEPALMSVAAVPEVIAPVPLVVRVMLPLEELSDPVPLKLTLLLIAVVRLTFVDAARVIAALTVIVPLFASPMLIVPAVTRSSSASDSSSFPFVGPPVEPTSIVVPLVLCLSVTTPVPAEMLPPRLMLSAVQVTAAPTVEPPVVCTFEPDAEMMLLFVADTVRFTAPLLVTMSAAPTVRLPDDSVMLTVPVPAFVPLTVTPPASVFVTCTPLVVFAKLNVETTVSIALVAPMPLDAVAFSVLAVTLVRLAASPSILPLAADKVTVAAPEAIDPAALKMMLFPVVRLTFVADARVIAALTVIAPLLVLPMAIVPPVMRSNSLSDSSSFPFVGPPDEPTSIVVPLVLCLSVTTPVPAVMLPPKSMLSAAQVTAAPAVEPPVVCTFEPDAELMLVFNADAVRLTAPLFVTMSAAPTVKLPDDSVMLAVPVPAFVPLTVNPPASVFVTCTALAVFAKLNVETIVSIASVAPMPLVAVAVSELVMTSAPALPPSVIAPPPAVSVTAFEPAFSSVTEMEPPRMVTGSRNVDESMSTAGALVIVKLS